MDHFENGSCPHFVPRRPLTFNPPKYNFCEVENMVIGTFLHVPTSTAFPCFHGLDLTARLTCSTILPHTEKRVIEVVDPPPSPSDYRSKFRYLEYSRASHQHTLNIHGLHHRYSAISLSPTNAVQYITGKDRPARYGAVLLHAHLFVRKYSRQRGARARGRCARSHIPGLGGHLEGRNPHHTHQCRSACDLHRVS